MQKNLEKNGFCATMAGIKKMYYAEIASVESVTRSYDGCSVNFASGYDWAEIECESANAKVTPDGGALRHEVGCTFVGSQAEVLQQLEAMTRRRHLVKLVDNNDTAWLMGDINTPLRFSFEEQEDGTPDGTSAYLLHFASTCNCGKRRIYN